VQIFEKNFNNAFAFVLFENFTGKKKHIPLKFEFEK
jgi:hypothetical protein